MCYSNTWKWSPINRFLEGEVYSTSPFCSFGASILGLRYYCIWKQVIVFADFYCLLKPILDSVKLCKSSSTFSKAYVGW